MPRAQKNIYEAGASGLHPAFVLPGGLLYQALKFFEVDSLLYLTRYPSSEIQLLLLYYVAYLYFGAAAILLTCAKMIIPVRCFSCGKVLANNSTSIQHFTNPDSGHRRSMGKIP